MKEIITQKFPIIIERYPSYSSLNSKILKEIENISFEMSYNLNLKAQRSGWNTTTPSLERLKKWVCDILVRDNSFLRDYQVSVGNCWVNIYSKGDSAEFHDHVLSPYSFVYFVKCPKGASPLVVGSRGKKIKAEEGKIAIFPGAMMHMVPKNKCDDRIVVAGNVEAS